MRWLSCFVSCSLNPPWTSSVGSSFEYLWTYRKPHRWVPQDLWGSKLLSIFKLFALFSSWTHRTLHQWVPHRRTFDIKNWLPSIRFSLGELSVNRFRAKDIFSLALNPLKLHRWVPHWTFGRHFFWIQRKPRDGFCWNPRGPQLAFIVKFTIVQIQKLFWLFVVLPKLLIILLNVLTNQFRFSWLVPEKWNLLTSDRIFGKISWF